MAVIKQIKTECRQLPDPRDGELIIRLVTGSTTPPPPDFAVDTAVHDYTVEIAFNPQYEMQSSDRAFSFLSAKFEAFSGLDPQLGRKIARHWGHVAHHCVCGPDRPYGVSVSVVLQTAGAAEEDKEDEAAADVILGNIVSDDGYRNGECCSVCLEGFQREEAITQLSLCFHKFHSECIIKWLLRKRTCPICRGVV